MFGLIIKSKTIIHESLHPMKAIVIRIIKPLTPLSLTLLRSTEEL